MNKILKMLSFLGLALTMLGTTGCSTSYWSDRGNDATDFIDIGVTYSKKPHVAAYAGFQSLQSVGYADVDGGMLGLGQGQFGNLTMCNRAGGMAIEGQEQYAFGNLYDTKNPASPEKRGAGLGMLYYTPPHNAMEFLQCPKFLHLGWIGLNVNCKIGELVDFVLGWTTLDIGKDDSAKREAKYNFMKAAVPAPAPASEKK